MSVVTAASPYYPDIIEQSSTGVSHESAVVDYAILDVREHFGSPVSRHSLASKFRDLAATWKRETAFTSSLHDIVMNTAYQRIIGLGPKVIPLILHELQRRPNHWFWALKALTAADPVKDEDRGDVAKMAEAWIEWGKKVKYLYA